MAEKLIYVKPNDGPRHVLGRTLITPTSIATRTFVLNILLAKWDQHQNPDPVSAYIGVASVIGPTKARKPPKPRCTTGPPASKNLKLPGKLF